LAFYSIVDAVEATYKVLRPTQPPTLSRVTTCLDNLEMSGNYTDVREVSGISLKVMKMSGNCQGQNLVMENCPKTFIIASTISCRISETVQDRTKVTINH